MPAMVSFASRNAFFTGAKVLPTSVFVIAAKVARSSLTCNVSPVDKVASMRADACVVRLSLASRAFCISVRVSPGPSSPMPVVSRIQQ